ncbi:MULTISPECIES: AraC family transcriptional regulator [unclassified Rhizobium]|uniref:helix-turn-helix domain-containing protein n=1 Tax=unclassified Rhizobium TaxID=2613769 RepID=UPI0017D26B3D|nr:MULTISPECIES: AraC family transcriptional regulator [unclassified Rhizobium]MBB3285386.1 AraC-like DNA-binding protein [Rhizobium sp. BK252]MBB3400125.1 AraC-like DNA-binding protein [Rhizobium sp. BK289]MBB3412705.1 AraC-like DNA-binding protein [Rhizobium sp. BK284]MBB3480591.1 AraC-like DNA-binding protein [Rhizobium sp. BK347]
MTDEAIPDDIYPLDDVFFQTPGRLSRALPYALLAAGRRICTPEEMPIAHRFNQHTLILTLSGKGLLQVNGLSSALCEGTIAWLDSSMLYSHRCEPHHSHWSYLWLGFAGHGLDTLFDSLGVIANPVFAISNPRDPQALFEGILRNVETGSFLSDSHCFALLTQLISLLVSARAEHGELSGAVQRLQRVMELVRADLSRPWSVDELAIAAHLSQAQLFRRFRQRMGTTPVDWLRHERVNAAKRLLVVTDEQIGRIAAQCGYPDPFHFARDFKKLVGVTPSEFRRQGQSARPREP